MKKLLWIGAACLALILGAAVIAPSLVDWNSYKPRIETLASETLDQPVRIAGDLSLRVLPAPRLRAQGLSVGTPDSLEDGPYIAADLLEVGVRLFPLLSGKIEANTVVLRAPDIRLQTGAEPAPDEAQSAGSSADISLPEVEIRDGRVTLISVQDGSTTVLSGIDLDIVAKSIDGPFSVEGAFALNDIPLTLSAATGNIKTADFPIEIEARLGDALTVQASGSATNVLDAARQIDGRFSIQANDLKDVAETLSEAAPPTLSGQALNLSSTLAVNGETVQLDGLSLKLGENNLTGAASVQLTQTPSITARLSGGRVDISDLLGETEEAPSGLEPIALTLPDSIKALLDVQIDELVGLPVAASQARLTAQLTSGQLKLTALSATLPGGTTLIGAGDFYSRNEMLQGTARLSLAGANARPILERLMGPDSAMPAGPLLLELAIDAALTDDAASAKAIVGRLGNTRFSASGRMAYGPVQDLSIKASLNELNLDDWMAEVSSAETQDRAAPAFDGKLAFDLGIDVLQRGGETFEDVAMKGRFEDDRLSLETARLGKANKAQVAASGTIDAATSDQPKLDLEFSANANNTNQLLALAGQEARPELETAGKFEASGTAKGRMGALDVASTAQLGDLKATISAKADLAGTSTELKGRATVSHGNLGALLSQFGYMDAAATTKGSPLDITIDFDQKKDTLDATLRFAKPQGQATIKVNQTPLTLKANVDAKAPDLVKFIRGLGLAFEPTREDLGPLDLKLALAGPTSALDIKPINATIGPAVLNGTGKLNLDAKTPRLDLKLNGKNLDLAALFPEPETGAQQVAEQTGERWSSEPFEFKILDSFDGSISLNLDRLTWRAYELTNAQLAMGSNGRTLRIALDKGNLFGGPMTLEATLDATKVPKLSTRMDIKDGSLEAATYASAALTPATGTFSLSGAFTGQGKSEKALVGALNGKATFATVDGIINDVDIVAVNERLGSLSTINDFLRLTSTALGGGQTAYQLISLDAVAQNGILSTQNVVTQIDGGAQADLDARINLPEWTVKANGRFALEDHPNAPPVGVAINGPMDSPVVEYQTKSLQEYMGVRLGAAVLKGVVRGEGFGLKDLLGGGRVAEEEPVTETSASEDSAAGQITPGEETPAPRKKTPEEELKELLIEGIFGFGRRNRKEE